MSLFARAAEWLSDTLADAAGVGVTYRRPPGAACHPLTAVVLSGQDVVVQPGERPVRAPGCDREYGFRLADLSRTMLFPPRPGDTVTERAGGRERVFRVGTADAARDCWEWGEPERVSVRVRCVADDAERPPVVFAGGG